MEIKWYFVKPQFNANAINCCIKTSSFSFSVFLNMSGIWWPTVLRTDSLKKWFQMYVNEIH